MKQGKQSFYLSNISLGILSHLFCPLKTKFNQFDWYFVLKSRTADIYSTVTNILICINLHLQWRFSLFTEIDVFTHFNSIQLDRIYLITIVVAGCCHTIAQPHQESSTFKRHSAATCVNNILTVTFICRESIHGLIKALYL